MTEKGEVTLSEHDEEEGEEVVIESPAPPVPDGGYGWFVVLGSMLVHLIIGGVERSAGVLYLRFLDRYQRSAAETAWVTAIPSSLRLIFDSVIALLSMITTGPVCSILSNRFTCRTVVICGTIAYTITMVISAFSPSLEFLLVVFGIIGGITRSFSYAPAVMMVGIYFNKRRGIAVGLSTCGVGFGTFAVPPLVEVLFSYYGFQGAFFILSGIVLNMCIAGMLFRPLTLQQKLILHDKRKVQKGVEKEIENGSLLLQRKPDKQHAFASLDSLNMEIKVSRKDLNKTGDKQDSDLKKKTDREKSLQISDSEQCADGERSATSKLCGCLGKKKNKKKDPDKPKKKFIDLSLLKDFRFFTFCIAILFFTLAFQSAFVFLPAYGKQIGEDDMRAAYLVVIAGASDGFARICSGIVLDLKRVKPYRVMIYNIVMYIVGAVSFIVILTKSYVQLCIVCGFYGLLIGTYISQKSVIIVDLLGAEKLINSFGIMICFQGIGMLVGPPLAGLLKDINGKYDYAFIVGGTAMLLGAVILTIGNVRHAIINRRTRKQ